MNHFVGFLVAIRQIPHHLKSSPVTFLTRGEDTATVTTQVTHEGIDSGFINRNPKVYIIFNLRDDFFNKSIKIPGCLEIFPATFLGNPSRVSKMPEGQHDGQI